MRAKRAQISYYLAGPARSVEAPAQADIGRHMKRLALIVVGVAALASFNVTAQSPAAHSRAPTFAKDVAPIMFNKCANCHRPGEVAPMSLLSYEDARPWAKAIKCKGRGARDAALGRRHDADVADAQRHQPVAERDRHDRGVGRWRRARAATPPTCRRRRSSPPAGPTAPSPTSSSRCRSSSTFPPKASSACRCSIRRCRGTRIASRKSSSCKPSNRAVLHHAGIYFVDIPEGASLVNGRIVGQGRQGDRRSRLARVAVNRQRAAGIEQAAVVGAGPRPRSSSRRTSASAFPPASTSTGRCTTTRPARREKDRTQARHLVQQGAGDARSADPPGRRSAGHDQGRAVDLSRRRPRGGIQGGSGQHAPQPQHAEHSAVRGELAPHRHHAGDRRHHALRDVAAHAPARQELEVGDRRIPTAARRRSSTCRSSTSTGSSTTS